MDSSGSRTATMPGFKEYISSRTPKTAQFQRTSQQMYVPPLSPRHTFHSNSSHPHLITPSRSSPSQQPTYVSRSPPKTYSNNLSRSPPKMTAQSQTRNTTTKKSNGSSRPTPKPLNLSKSSQVSNLGRVPQTATFPPKVNRALNLPQPPKTATFPKQSSGFPKDLRVPLRVSQILPQPAYAYMYDQVYLQSLESPRLRRYSASPAPIRHVTMSNYRQYEMGPGTPVVVLSHPDDSDSQGSSPPTPGLYPSEGYSNADLCDFYGVPYEGDEFEESQYGFYYYEYPQEYLPQTPTRTPHTPRSSTMPPTPKDQRRRSVFGGPMKIHPDTVVPIRQPKGPDMAKNFATRIRRKAASKLLAAAAERRSKSASDRRKSAMF
jgi:hypothetical protein